MKIKAAPTERRGTSKIEREEPAPVKDEPLPQKMKIKPRRGGKTDEPGGRSKASRGGATKSATGEPPRELPARSENPEKFGVSQKQIDPEMLKFGFFGLLGVVIAVYLFARAKKINPLSLGDIASAATPFGLFFGRIAHFINSEVVGRASDVPGPWCSPVQEMCRAIRASSTKLRSKALSCSPSLPSPPIATRHLPGPA